MWQRNLVRFVFNNKLENITFNRNKKKFKIKLPHFILKILILFKILWLEIIKCLYRTKNVYIKSSNKVLSILIL